jgi:hypothetical protein
MGLCTYLLLPVLSMTNPPVNWGYSRTVEGFWHLVFQGQYEQPNPAFDPAHLKVQWEIYGKVAAKEFGIWYVIAAFIPLFFLHKMSPLARRWIIAMLGLWLVFSTLTLIGLNPSPDRQSVQIHRPYFAPTHLLLASLSGCGLMLVGRRFARSRPLPSTG